LDQPEKLREQAQQDGYLFFRGLIDTDSIYSLRQDFLEICHRHGWAQGGEALMDGIRTGGPFMEGDDGYVPVLDEFQSMESFHAFAHHPAILDMCDKLFGEKTLVHPRNIGRIMFPENTKYTTPAHQDYIHIRGTEETYTAWIPLGPCLTELGGLSILSGSHRSGIYPVKPAFGAGGLGIDTEPLEADGLYWVAGDYEIGDALFFHSHAVHKALPNQSPDRIRLSVDYRYQGSSQPVTEGSLLPHFNRMAWDEIYTDWKSTQYQYYWNAFDLNRV
jgi:ectoine hydroxylase-related dioxygenase (phytanoyl-CoA dioxygenase family)